VNHRFVQSLGTPYFAFTAENVGDLSTLPSFGLAAVSIEFRIDRLPRQIASATEMHGLFAFDHDFATQPPLWEIGITPSGRLRQVVKSGSVWQTREGQMLAGETWHTLESSYDFGTGQWRVTLDGGPEDTSVIDGAPVAVLPNAGYQTRLMLFNARDALCNTGASARSLFVSFIGAGTTNLLYDFSERAGGTLAPTASGAAPDAMPARVMSAAFYNPLVTAPYGLVPSDSPNAAYRWGLATDFTRVPKPTTTYTRVPA